ncbi:MAG: hypothetical protein VX919_05940 [Candidatus Thermoplasmatota archaeon]|nr:hypothetical protein [Candidatus Thermoplasmatota archaeon]
MAFALILLMVYTVWRLFIMDGDIHYGDHRVVSPIFSPDVLYYSGLTDYPGWLNSAILILWLPFGFRGTCYYMRRVYYRSFFASPVACWVDEPDINKKIGYAGEKRLFIFNNLHRYFLYAALAILLFKWWDVVHSMRITESFILDFGTIVLATESFLLTMYVTSCHAFRHLVGGMLDRWDGGMAGFRGRLHSFVTKPWINRSHGFWFWTSLGFVFIGDLFVMSVANGTIPESSIVLLGGV